MKARSLDSCCPCLVSYALHSGTKLKLNRDEGTEKKGHRDSKASAAVANDRLRFDVTWLVYRRMSYMYVWQLFHS